MEQLVIEIAGIGQAASIALTKHGFKTVADVANASVESLSVVPGFASARSLQTIKKAKDLLKEVDVATPAKVIAPVASEEKAVSKEPIKIKKAPKKSKNKDKKVAKNKDKKIEKNKLKLEAKKLAKKVAKLKAKKAAKDKAKKASSKAAAKKKSAKKSKKK